MKNKIRALLIILAAMIAATVTVYAAYDSATDPLISKSYLEQVFKAEVDKEIASLNATIVGLQNKITDLEGQLTQANASQASISVIRLTKGQQIVCKGGNDVSTEIILRAGLATAVAAYSDHNDPDAQGLSDVTASAELLRGDSLTINHLIIVPRGDGRGVLVTSDEAYFMVRGPYDIVSVNG